MMLKWLPYQDADPDLQIRLDDPPGTFRYKGRKVSPPLNASTEDWARLGNLDFEVRYPDAFGSPRGQVVYVRRVPPGRRRWGEAVDAEVE